MPAHLMTGTDRALSSWLSMMRRCFITAEGEFKNYGARGITVCESWYDWRNFLADMGERPEGLSLDRIDTDGPYEPANCRWADVVTQNRNTRRNVVVEVDGLSMLACDAAKYLGITPSAISQRRRRGAPLAERRPLKLTPSQVKQIKARLSTGSRCTDIAKEFGTTRQNIASIRDGKTWGAIQ